MKLDKRGFPTTPLPIEASRAWAIVHVAPEDWADFFGSQARLHRRSLYRWLALAVVFLAIAAISLLDLLSLVMGMR